MRIKISLYIVTFFLFSSFTFGQNLLKKNDDKFADIKQTTKIDEFGDISEKEFAPKLKKFAEMMRKNDAVIGYVIFYNDFNSTPFKKTQYFADAKFESYTKYLQSRSYDPPRLIYVKGGLREKMTTELWLVRKGAETPKPVNSLIYEKNEKYKLDKLETRRIPIEEAKIKTERVDEDCDINEGNCSLEKEILFFFNNDSVGFFEGFAEELGEILSRDKTWRAKLFFYADKDEYDIRKSQQIIENQIKINFEKLNANLSQVQIIFGGYESYPKMETWIIPKDGIEPEPMPNEKIEEN